MLQLETQSSYKGFGNGTQPNECLHSSNMCATPFGFAPFYKAATDGTEATITGGMTLLRWIVEYGGVPWAIDDTGKLVSNRSNTWLQEHANTASGGSSGNGLIVDQTGRLLFMNNQYLSKLVGTSTYTENWKDFGTSVTTDKGMDTYLDWVIIPHGNQVGILNVTDDSFNGSGLTFPSGCSCITAKSSRTGVLLGVNMGNRSFIALWDAQATRAIADWIWFDHPIKSICRAGDSEWIVTTSRGLYQTNGYTKKTLPDMPDPVLGRTMYNPLTGGTWTVGNLLYLAHTSSPADYGRGKNGLYILNLDTNLWLFVPSQDYALQNSIMGAVFGDSSSRLWFSHRNIATSQYKISQVINDVPARAHFITAPFGSSNIKKYAEGARVELVANNISQNVAPMSFDVSVKIYNYARPLWGHGNAKVQSAALNQITVNGQTPNINNAQVGDELTILSGLNAGHVRHITAISGQNTSTEVWTLDSDLPNLTEANALFNVQPFKLVKKFTITSQTAIPTDGLYFDIKDRPQGKRFLLKVLLENLTSAYLAVPSVSFAYDDSASIT